MFEVFYSERALKYLEKLEKKDAVLIYRKIELLKDNPIRFIEKLAGLDLWKLRVCDYRTIIRLDRAKNEIVVVDIGHRRDVYKNL